MDNALGFLKNNDLTLHARSLFLKRPRGSGIIPYLISPKLEQLNLKPWRKIHVVNMKTAAFYILIQVLYYMAEMSRRTD